VGVGSLVAVGLGAVLGIILAIAKKEAVKGIVINALLGAVGGFIGPSLFAMFGVQFYAFGLVVAAGLIGALLVIWVVGSFLK